MPQSEVYCYSETVFRTKSRNGLILFVAVSVMGCVKDNTALRVQSGLTGTWNGENALRVVEFKGDGTGTIFDAKRPNVGARPVEWDIAIPGTLQLWINDEDAGPGLSQHKFKFGNTTDSIKIEESLPDGLAWHLKRRH